MSFSKITHPLTNETISIFSIAGKNLLKNYVKMYKKGGMQGLLSDERETIKKINLINNLN